MTRSTPHAPPLTALLATFAVIAFTWLCLVAFLLALAILAFSGSINIQADLPPNHLPGTLAQLSTPGLHLSLGLHLIDSCSAILSAGYTRPLYVSGDGLILDLCVRALVLESTGAVLFYW
jgi:hypothetical protein